jgi:site-specific recombinase XerD
VRLDGEQGKLAPSTLKRIIQTVKRFFTWLKLAYVREYRDLSLAWIEALRPPRGIELPTEHIFVTPGEVQQIIGFQVPVEDLALRRDQAAVAMLFLSGMRASAFATLPIAAVDLVSRTIKQWPALGVDTKNGKSATTLFAGHPRVVGRSKAMG